MCIFCCNFTCSFVQIHTATVFYLGAIATSQYKIDTLLNYIEMMVNPKQLK